MIDYVDDFIQEIKERKPSATAIITVNGFPVEKVISDGNKIDIIAEREEPNYDDLEYLLNDIELSVDSLREKIDKLKKL